MVARTLKIVPFILCVGLIIYGADAARKPVKIIQVEGDTVECIKINEQPSLDHPLLKNHKIQMKPTALPVGMEESRRFSSANATSDEHINEADCPAGTVPIYTSFENHNRNVPDDVPGGKSHFCMVRMSSRRHNRYRGVSGRVSVYDLDAEKGEMSLSQVLIENGAPLNQIAMGVMVGPSLYGDSHLRLFVYWTTDGGNKTGCFNLRCKGFVQVHPRLAPGARTRPLSTYGGTTFVVSRAIFQDRQTGNWWVATKNSTVHIGYFPRELVPSLNDRENFIAWGGNAISGSDGDSPPMGSGHWPDNRIDHSAYFHSLGYVDDDYVHRSPGEGDTVEDVDKSGCYILDDHKLQGPKQWGYAFNFGGPGGDCG